ncbi:HAD-IA family hydrolase [Campylobacter jejuni]
MYNTILFDLDGTLLDTTDGVLKAVKKTIIQLNFTMPSDNILKEFVGPPMQESFEKYFCLNENDALKNANIFREIYKEFLYEAKLYNGVIELLEQLKNNHFKIAIATNKSHENAINILKKFNILDFCDYVKGSDLEGKLTKKDIVKECLMYLQADTTTSVLIGDSVIDANGAKDNNIDFLAVLYGFGFKDINDLKNIQYKKSFESTLLLSNYLLNKGAAC